MFELDKWDTKVLVRESWNSSFVWLAEPICHGYMSTLLNSWVCCWSLLLLQFSSVITYVIRLNFWKGSFLLASALIHTPQQVLMGSWARFIKTKFAHLSLKQRISFRIFDIYFPHSTYYLYVTVHKVHRYTYERDLMSVDGWFWLESNTFCDIVNKVRPRLMDPVGSVQFQIRLDERSQLDFFFGLFHYY